MSAGARQSAARARVAAEARVSRASSSGRAQVKSVLSNNLFACVCLSIAAADDRWSFSHETHFSEDRPLQREHHAVRRRAVHRERLLGARYRGGYKREVARERDGVGLCRPLIYGGTDRDIAEIGLGKGGHERDQPRGRYAVIIRDQNARSGCHAAAARCPQAGLKGGATLYHASKAALAVSSYRPSKHKLRCAMQSLAKEKCRCGGKFRAFRSDKRLRQSIARSLAIYCSARV